MAFKFLTIDPSSGCEIWSDPATGDRELRNCPKVVESSPPPPAVDAPSPQSQSQSANESARKSYDDSPDVQSAKSASKSESAMEISGQSGVYSRGDDSPSTGPNQTQQMVNSAYNGVITPQPNVLSDYASYTYQMTWYLLTPEQYTSLTSMGAKSASTWQILIQSGGAATGNAPGSGATGFGDFMDSLLSSNSTAQGNMTGIRNKYFNLDYYMDDFEIDTLVPLKGTGAAHSATNISFTVTEPMGVTLLDNLYRAVSDMYKSSNGGKSTNYSMAFYCLGIRFYGYDDQGNLVKVGRSGSNGQMNLTDPSAIVEKFYPFVLKNISFRMTNSAVKYKVDCAPQGQFYNVSTDRGTIPFQYEFTGATVKDILVSGGTGKTGGQGNADNAPAADGRKSSSQPKTNPPKPAPTSTIYNPSQGILNGGSGGGTSTEALGLGIDY